MQPITIKEIVENLQEAIKARPINLDEVEKWETLLKSEQETIYRARLRGKELQDNLYRLALKDSYRLYK